MMNTYEISRIEEWDFHDCARIRSDAWQNLPDNIVPQKIKETQSLKHKLIITKKIFEDMKQNKKVLLKCTHNKVICWILDAQYDPPELGALYVTPTYQWLWVWSALFTYLVEDFRNRWFDSFFLRWIKNNTQSRDFYLKMWCKLIWEIDTRTKWWISLEITKYMYDLKYEHSPK